MTGSAGKKLSALQQTILRLAHRNHLAGKDRLYYHEILHEHFGFKLEPEATLDRQHFSRSRIGRKRYASAQASLSRAVRRLRDRGLVEAIAGLYARRVAVRLTKLGIETVETITR